MTKEKKVENPKLGDLVAGARRAQGRSARDVAREAKIDIHTMTKLEQGHYASPSPHTLRGVSSALGIPLLRLFEVAGYVTRADVVEMTKNIQIPVFTREQVIENERKFNEFLDAHSHEFDDHGRVSDAEATT